MRQDELYHWGVPGMKWGKRKARPVSEVDQRRIASNDRRVGKYGVKRVKTANRLAGAATVAGAIAATALINKLKKKKISELSGEIVKKGGKTIIKASPKAKTVSRVALAAIAGVSILAIANMKRLRNDNKLANQYASRQEQAKTSTTKTATKKTTTTKNQSNRK